MNSLLCADLRGLYNITGEYRVPKVGENYIRSFNAVGYCTNENAVTPRHIVTKVSNWEEAERAMCKRHEAGILNG